MSLPKNPPFCFKNVRIIKKGNIFKGVTTNSIYQISNHAVHTTCPFKFHDRLAGNLNEFFAAWSFIWSFIFMARKFKANSFESWASLDTPLSLHAITDILHGKLNRIWIEFSYCADYKIIGTVLPHEIMD